MNRLGARLLLAILGGLFQAGALPPLGWWALEFFGLALLLRSLRGARLSEAALLGSVWGIAGLAAPGRWVLGVALARGESVLSPALALGVLAATPALFGLVHVLLARAGLRVAIVAPFAWVAFEELRAHVPLFPCSWFALPHALAFGSPPLVQVTTLVGASGLSLLVAASSVLLESGLFLLLEKRSRGAVHLAIGLGAPVIVWQLGFLVLCSAVPTEAQLQSALQTVIVQDPSSEQAKLLLSLGGLRKAKDDFTPRVDALLWPGDGSPRDPFAAGHLEPSLLGIAERFGHIFVLGCPRPVAGGLAPSVIAIAPDGRLLGEHREGEEPCVVDIGRERIGLALGPELWSGGALRALASRGATVVFVAARDRPEWPEEARYEAASEAVLRAIELHRPVLYAAASGPSLSLDPIGRPYRALRAEGEQGLILSRTAGPRDATLYALAGHATGSLSILVLVGCVIWAAVQRRPSRSAAAATSASR
jgi:apolipoprotein N-acyltransferase